MMCCRCSPTLVLSPALELWLRDSNEMSFQGLNLSSESTQESAYHHDSALLQPAMNTEEICSPRKWKHKHFVMIACLQAKLYVRMHRVRAVYELIAEYTQLFEHHFCDLLIAPVTRHLFVGACDFSNLIGSQKYFYAQPIIPFHSSTCTIHEAILGVNKVDAVDNFSALNWFALKCSLFYSEVCEQLSYDGGIEP